MNVKGMILGTPVPRGEADGDVLHFQNPASCKKAGHCCIRTASSSSTESIWDAHLVGVGSGEVLVKAIGPAETVSPTVKLIGQLAACIPFYNANESDMM